MVDPLSPMFAKQVDHACEVAADKARHASSFLDWREIMQALVTSFRDGHTGIRFNVEPTQMRWPGFLIDGQGGRWVVRRPSSIPATDSSPPEGAELVACDGQPAEKFLAQALDQKTVDWSKAPERIRQAFRAFTTYRLDGPPPATKCRFRQNGNTIDVPLEWQPIASATMQPLLAPYLRRGATSRPIDVSFAPDGHVWLRLGNFLDEPALKALEVELLAKQTLLRSAPYVVFDLRGNGGGNSTWGGRLASILWGKDAVEARRLADQSSNPADYGKYWRRSKVAASKMHAAADEYAAEGRDFAEIAQFWRELGDTIAAVKGDGLYQDECCRPKPRPSVIPATSYAGKVFVLTDAGCFSSGVVVMNTLKRMGAIQIGEPSGQNEVYGESVGPFNLPSGLGWYRIPVSIIRQPRSSLGGLPPDIVWSGAMDDDQGLRQWIATLASGARIQ
ncbi:MAG TPA: S41 family peptidase [Gemmatimonadaceae bacterium]|nr:S41 family peptidase [Gemmatimonadaceae bacterium]